MKVSKLWGVILPLTAMACLCITTISHSQGPGRITDGVIALYGFNEGTGTTVTDVSGVGTPLDLIIEGPSNVTWLPSGGLSIDTSTLIASPGPATKIYDAVQSTQALTIEAWIKPANTTQSGPARIVTMSQSPSVRNFTLGQGPSDGNPGDVYDVRFRSSTTSPNGIPSLSSPLGTLTTNLTHVVYTRDASGATTMYLNGVLAAQGMTTGTVTDWNNAYQLAIGNELTLDRPWLGELHLVAFSQQALSAQDVQQNFNAGPVAFHPNPAISLTKEPTSQTVFSVGNVSFSFTVSNIGNDPLTNVVLADPDCGPLTQTNNGDGDAILNIGEVWGYTCEITNVVNNLTNSATVTATDSTGASIMDSASAQVIVATNERITAGQVVLYTFQEGTGTQVNDVSGIGAELNLFIQDPNAVQWLSGGGLSINAPTILQPTFPASKITGPITASNELTVEAWVKPANLTQTGPARIVTISDGTGSRNLTLGQGEDLASLPESYDVRLRSTTTTNNGLPPLSSVQGSLTTELTHVVYTRESTGITRIYLDGIEVAQGTIGGDLSNWDSTFGLALGNETTQDRPWLGEYHLVAIFDRALSSAEVIQNFQAVTLGPTTVTFRDGENGYASTVDTLIRGAAPDTPRGNAPIFNWSQGESKYGLLRFENIIGSGTDQVPPGAIIDSAMVTLTVIIGGSPTNVYESAVDWEESVTFNTFGGEPDVQPDELGTLISPAGGNIELGLLTIDVTASLQSWANNPTQNHGWIFESTGTNNVEVRSRNDSSVADRPLLSVTYSLSTNTPPVANAGPDQAVPRNTLVTLDGSGSNDADSDPLTFSWTIMNKPTGSTAMLTNATNVNPTFTTDVDGAYTIQLIVNDDTENSVPDTVVITAENTQPIANAGLDQNVGRHILVTLDGSGSSDLNKDPLTYDWTIIAQPTGSLATLANATTVNPTFTPDLEGTYVLQLIVNDGSIDSAPNTVTITAVNSPPILDPVGDQTIPLGQILTFTLTGSDPNNDSIAFTATPLPLPANMTVNGSNGEVTFAPDGTQVGDHVLTMMISDGLLVDSETITITVNQVASPSGTTELTGRLLDTNDFVATGTETPIVGATVSLLNTGFTAITDSQGNFTLTGLPSGTQIFDIDPATANLAPDGSPYAGFREKMTLVANVTNMVTRPFYLPRIDASSITPVVSGTPTTVTNATLGITMTVPADTAKNLDGTDYTGVLSISEVPAGLAPAAMPEELQPGLVITIQPPGVTFETPVSITFPNIDNLPPGTQTDLWSLDPETGTFIIVGTGTVSANGTQIVNTNGGIRATDWHFSLPPRPDPSPQPNPPPNNPSRCPTGSATELCSGNLTVEHQLASYRSLGVDRSPKLFYGSLRADPQPMIANNMTIPALSAVPLTIAARLEVAGIEQGTTIFTDTMGLVETQDEIIRQVVQFDASLFATGSYPYSLMLTNHFTVSAAGAPVSDTVLVRNDQASSIGAGWTLENVSRLHVQPNGDALITEGKGTSRRFSRSLPGELGVGATQSTRQFAATMGSGDLNGDGIPDIVVGAPSGVGGHIHVHLANGDGTIAPGVDYSIGGDPHEVIIVDLDGDGAQDVLVATGQLVNQIRVAYGNGTGILEPFVGYPVPSSSGGNSGPEGVLVTEVNADGFNDLVITCSGSHEVVIMLGNGTRMLGAPIYSIHTGGVFGPSRAVAADFNQDGHMDVVTANVKYIALLPGDGTGQYPTLSTFGGGIDSATLMTSGDWNADGWPDVALAKNTVFGGNRVYVYQNNRVGGFLPVVTYLLRTTGTVRPNDIRSGDLNADGILDLVTVNAIGTVSWLAGDADGSFNAPVETSFSGGGIGGVLGDWNSDGLLDVAVTAGIGYPGVSEVTLLLNTDPSTDFLSPRDDFSLLDELPDGTFTRTMKDGTQIHFDTLGRQTSMVDRNGNTTIYVYDGSSDRLVTMTDPANLITTYAYGVDNRLDSITDPAGRVTTFDHDADGNLISITDPDTSMRQFTYDARHKMTTQTSKRGVVTQYEYNFAGRHVKATRGDGSTRELIPAEMAGVVNPASGLGTESNPAPVVRPGEVIATYTDGNGNATTFETDEFGQPTVTVDPLGRETRVVRDSASNPVETTNPNGAITRRTYDNFGNVLSLKEAEGQPEERTTMFEYDPTFNQLIKVTDPAGKITTIQLDANGNPEKVINPLLDERTRTFNPQGLVLTDTDENGKITTLTYDANGNVETITDAEGHVTQFTRDQAGNVLTFTEGVGTPEMPLARLPMTH